MSSRLIRLVAVLFSGFIVAMIITANTGIRHPGTELVRVLPYGDKVGHAVLFGSLTLIVNLALSCRTIRPPLGPRLLTGTVAITIFVIVEELSQGFVATRSLDATDLMADLVGITLASLAAPPLYRLLAAGGATDRGWSEGHRWSGLPPTGDEGADRS